MTIKELCKNQDRCSKCSFYDACEFLDCVWPCNNLDEDQDKLVTKSIIETAKILTEGNNHDTSI